MTVDEFLNMRVIDVLADVVGMATLVGAVLFIIGIQGWKDRATWTRRERGVFAVAGLCACFWGFLLLRKFVRWWSVG